MANFNKNNQLQYTIAWTLLAKLWKLAVEGMNN